LHTPWNRRNEPEKTTHIAERFQRIDDSSIISATCFSGQVFARERIDAMNR